MKKTIYYLSVFFLLFTSLSKGQENVLYDQTNTWFTLLNRLNVNEKWSVSNEIHERLGAFLKEQETFIFRPSVDYHFNKNVEVSFGYSYINNQPNDPYPTPKSGVHENNIWTQALLKNDVGKVHLQHRFRQENRWYESSKQNEDGTITNSGTQYANRFRYRLTLNTDIIKFEGNHALFFAAFDEIWLPQTDKLLPKNLSRNWLYTGLGYRFNKKTNLQIGYMNQFDNIGGTNYVSTGIIQTTFVRNFDL
jgi:hypothetical protein